jgi:septal ring factor EnvC (AmiA/AmiB activator)
VAYVESSQRVGRSQAASIFWGLVSVCFAAAACYYYWNNHENETSASVLRDQVLTLQEERDSLSAQKDKLQSSISDSETQLKSREDFLQEKETRLAEEETRLEALDQKSQAASWRKTTPMSSCAKAARFCACLIRRSSPLGARRSSRRARPS